jgi:hypothetical protein
VRLLGEGGAPYAERWCRSGCDSVRRASYFALSGLSMTVRYDRPQGFASPPRVSDLGYRIMPFQGNSMGFAASNIRYTVVIEP